MTGFINHKAREACSGLAPVRPKQAFLKHTMQFILADPSSTQIRLAKTRRKSCRKSRNRTTIAARANGHFPPMFHRYYYCDRGKHPMRNKHNPNTGEAQSNRERNQAAGHPSSFDPSRRSRKPVVNNARYKEAHSDWGNALEANV